MRRATLVPRGGRLYLVKSVPVSAISAAIIRMYLVPGMACPHASSPLLSPRPEEEEGARAGPQRAGSHCAMAELSAWNSSGMLTYSITRGARLAAAAGGAAAAAGRGPPPATRTASPLSAPVTTILPPLAVSTTGLPCLSRFPAVPVAACCGGLALALGGLSAASLHSMRKMAMLGGRRWGLPSRRAGSASISALDCRSNSISAMGMKSPSTE